MAGLFVRIRKSPTGLIVLAMLALCSGAGPASQPAATSAPAPASHPAEIDFLDYFLQSDDRGERWTINGTDVRPAPDPDGTSGRTVVLAKWSDPNCYEVFKITPSDVQIRYEVVRNGDASGAGNWIRRYREAGAPGDAPGAIWMKRHIVPGGEGFISRFSQDRWTFDPAKRQYVIDPAGSVERMELYASCDFADVKWPHGNTTGFRIDRVLRLTSQWQREGLIFETYDYAKGKGLVGWRWLERISTLKALESDQTGRIFHCEEGLVFIEPAQSKPRAWRYDNGKKTRELEVISFVSRWQPKLGAQWYVVYRDLSREKRLTKKMEQIPVSFSLPEWDSSKTLVDLRGQFTK